MCTVEMNMELAIKDLNKTGTIDAKPVFDYIARNDIKMYDLKNMKMEEMDVSNPKDIERYVLSHIYYIIVNNYNN